MSFETQKVEISGPVRAKMTGLQTSIRMITSA